MSLQWFWKCKVMCLSANNAVPTLQPCTIAIMGLQEKTLSHFKLIIPQLAWPSLHPTQALFTPFFLTSVTSLFTANLDHQANISYTFIKYESLTSFVHSWKCLLIFPKHIVTLPPNSIRYCFTWAIASSCSGVACLPYNWTSTDMLRCFLSWAHSWQCTPNFAWVLSSLLCRSTGSPHSHFSMDFSSSG